ncbi:heme oxygenase-like protein [Meira miltonrushii]|uniref:Heme oxygenase-like protein n=1 Tax=Meira miltonrushii TaxID=1280837 RepID=A0A316VEK5_9BASI|nr:heme oxygenase-like protein [Meira miltonrushii]PWN34421.1 heme oxygenase-like protein [Meira miltonrushii]
MVSGSLTEALLSLPNTSESYKRATQHPFLQRAGTLSLSTDSLQRWLTQDRLYALVGYSAFLGTLIAKLPAPIVGPSSSEGILHRRRLSVLAGAMANIDREVGFFEQVAKDNGLDLAAKSKPTAAQNEVDSHPQTSPGSSLVDLGLLNNITRGYIDFMVSTASRGTFEEGLVLLWAMEKMYLDAWTYASKHLKSEALSSKANQQPGPAKALLQLIPNWSSAEFAQFVKDIGELIDGLDVKIDSDLGKRLQEVWIVTLWYEERFWQAGE